MPEILKFIVGISIWFTSIIGCKNEVTLTPENSVESIEIKERNEANIWFLGHSGFAVQTLNYFLIFDYVEEHLRNSYGYPENPSLSNGYIKPEEIRDLRVRVFTTHEHDDHWDPVILEWANHVTDIEYFFGWQASNRADYHYLIGPRAVWQDDDMEIYTINSEHAGVPEVAYLVKVDGLAIYHNGDYQGSYQEDVTHLETKADHFDVAFLFCVWQEQWTYYWVNRELITRLQPKAVFPMHVRVGDEEDYFEPFQSTYQPMLTDGRVVLTHNVKGRSYYYKNGEITQY